MLDFLTTSNNLPFAVALAMMLMLSVLELLSFLFGASVSGFLDGLFDFDFDFEAGDADGSELAGHSLAQLELQSGLARGALIHHLRKMEEVSLIRRQQKGARTEYRLDGSALAPLYAMIGA